MSTSPTQEDKMEKIELKFLLKDAKHEIVALRSRNQVLEAQIGVVEVFAAALGLKRGESGASIDVAWQLQQEIDTMNKGNLEP